MLGEKFPIDQSGPETDTWDKDFEVISVSRADLVQAGFPPELVAQLTDEQMERIAAKMGDYYNDQGYWGLVTVATETITGLTAEMGGENSIV
jgi:hypothetical protein